MRVIVIGGTGFIGQHLVRRIFDTGLDVVILSRRPSKVAEVFERHVMGFAWDGKTANGWSHLVDADTYIVNLAGENIADGRWTPAKRERIMQSRLDAGRAVVDAVQKAATKPALVIQGSAVGYYGPLGEELVDETAMRGSTGFLSAVARDWEKSSLEVENLGVARAVVRTGVVLGSGGALAKMLPPFRLGLGGPLGSGAQGMSWIHVDDEVGAMLFIMQRKLTGVFNLTAPNPVSNREFSKVLGTVLGRPAFLPAPAFALRMLFGQMADEVLLSGQRVLPKRLMEAGYAFRYPDLADALANAVASNTG
ncbi:MAG: TIGR01777 family oxidoreductase [Proteobacteria bacterium]|nr:TIGR01777 family oxidoreductase [Pseudomonadota bacterium]MBU1612177.1 TIGR01777 family oxidoreductase [Pseudomonadota bacterium]